MLIDYRVLVYLAAINPILILFLGPLAQQSVVVKLRSTISTGEKTSLPTVIEYDAPSTIDTSTIAYPLTSNRTLYMHEAVLPVTKIEITQGLVGEAPSFSDVKAICRTANCTFQPYTTLGVCSSTQDYTDHLVTACNQQNTNSVCNWTVDELQTMPPIRKDHFINYGKIYLVWLGSSQLPLDENYRTVGPEENEPKTDPLHTWHPYEDTGTLVEFYVLYKPKSSPVGSTDKPIRALKGSLKLCLYALNTTVKGGETVTTILKTYDDLKWQIGNKTSYPDLKRYHNQTWNAYAQIPNSPNLDIYAMNLRNKGSLTTYLSREVFFGHTGIQDGTIQYLRATGDASRAYADAMFRHEGDRKWEFIGLEPAEKLLENVAIRMTNA